MYTSSKRVFTKNNINLNYQDYNKLKNGIEILKTIKSEDNLAVLKKFKNYQSLQTLNSAYFPFIDNDTFEVTYLKNIFNANESFTNKEDFLDNNMCKNVLYPYGKIVSKKIVNPQFSTNIYLCKWCNGKPKINKSLNEIDEIDEIDEISIPDCDCDCDRDLRKKQKKTNCNLCKNARSLFI
jgi:hypothetical protein